MSYFLGRKKTDAEFCYHPTKNISFLEGKNMQNFAIINPVSLAFVYAVVFSASPELEFWQLSAVQLTRQLVCKVPGFCKFPVIYWDAHGT